MRDIGHEQTEEVLKEIEKRISEEYAIAEKEIAEKLDDYLKKFRVKDALKQKAVDSGKITEEEYKQWRVGQIMMTKRWTEMRDTLAEDFTNADKIARSIAYDHMPEVYAINHDYATFQVEKGSLMDTSYTLYDRNAFEQLVKDEDTFIPAPGRKVSRDIKEGKALAWNKKQVQSVMMQGLLQGESIPKLAKRLSKTVGESDRKAAIRNARTMTTGVQNAGRVASYDRANKMGIETRKQWLATLDSRTRHWHASLDGEVVDNDKPFQNDFGDIMYPGDPTADPANIFNCRCTLIASIKGFERDVSNTDLRHDDHLKDMSYEEWREGHYEQTSEPITRQEDMSEKIKNDYIQDYIDINASIPDEIREGFDKFEDKYSNAKTEHYIAYDKDGNVIFESSNKGKTNVSVPKYIDEQNEGGYSIHNHPAEATFSAQDISNYERYGQNGLVCDIEGNEYILLNKNPSVDDLVKKAKTEDEVAELMPFSTAAHKAFSEIDNDVMTRRREYSKELMATETDGSVRSAKMREWMAENNPENLKNAWLEENASKYGFEFKKQKLKGEDNTINDLTTVVEGSKIKLGGASNFVSEDAEDAIKEYSERMSRSDRKQFNRIFDKAEFAENTEDERNYYNPDDGKIYLSEVRDSTLFHEGAHWLDYNQDYTITSDWGRYKKVYDDDGNLISKEWVPDIVTIKEHAGFSEYISDKWNGYIDPRAITSETYAGEDIRNAVKLLGTSDTYGNNRPDNVVKHDMDAVKAYLDSKGVSRSDPDFEHLSDFISAITYDASLGSLSYGGHDYDYWINGEKRVAEITTGYNLLKCLGREDFIKIERELAPHLMSMIEPEWEKIWKKKI